MAVTTKRFMSDFSFSAMIEYTSPCAAVTEGRLCAAEA
jgi:hypothetical protein